MQKLLKDLGPVTAIIGAQWGDEGKGKLTDILGEHYDVIARANGGANAGHTIVVNGKKHIFRLLPAGCLHPGKPIVLGSGMVIHLPTLMEEIELLRDAGTEIVDRLSISGAAHILFDYHKDIDGVLEGKRSQGIGTTRKGIGPAYMEKAARTGIRFERLPYNLADHLKERAIEVMEMFDVKVDVDTELASLKKAASVLTGCIIPSLPKHMFELLAAKKTILIEGAQATLLDIDHGTYPFVTSSSTTASGMLQGLGLPPKALFSSIGVVKAYCTRVGAGDFKTEETGERGEELRERGGEYGSVTGRPRRCGWLSIADIELSTVINGFTAINLTKLDVLDSEEKIPLATRIDHQGKPIYEEFLGWKTSTRGITKYGALPKEARVYIETIEKLVGVPIRFIGTGQGREEMIVR